MQTISYITFIVSLLSIVQSSTKTSNPAEKCLADLVTQEFSDSYNYLQLSLKLGATNAYPGFSSFFTKLSDNDASKAHDIVKLLILRKIKLEGRLINKDVTIRSEITNANNVSQSLKAARNQNEKAWKIVIRCHQEADANIQDYLESHVLDHHIEIDKLLADFEDRLNNAHVSEKELITFMLDEELLNTYGDGRKDIFS